MRLGLTGPVYSKEHSDAKACHYGEASEGLQLQDIRVCLFSVLLSAFESATKCFVCYFIGSKRYGGKQQVFCHNAKAVAQSEKRTHLSSSEVATAARNEFCWLKSRFWTASSWRRWVALSSTASGVRRDTAGISDSRPFRIFSIVRCMLLFVFIRSSAMACMRGDSQCQQMYVKALLLFVCSHYMSIPCSRTTNALPN